MRSNITKSIRLSFCALIFTTGIFAQVGINTAAPSKQLDINAAGLSSDGINISNDNFNAQLLTEPVSGGGTFVVNNSSISGTTVIRFNNTTRFGFSNSALWPSVNATSPFVTGALDLGRFDRHYRRMYTRGVHTNDDDVDGGLGISIGSGGGAQSDYIFSDFAFYPVASQVKDLGRNGNFWNNLYLVSAFTPSDKRLKKNIKAISHGSDMLNKLRVYEYNYIFEDNNKTHYGFLAQELQALLPELVSVGDDKAKSLSINYTETIPIIIKAIQEQHELIEQQGNEIKELKEMVKELMESK
ncbi:tail fiber domain-containing protein [Dokdonia sinensis]|uniref:Tail fiber domain-containing protein n=1 Tax=Dokdonia sinensis TaxID=2479847 RepID=A0A3M0GA59_9FLAO|nr:tail fiber domain-containing protein [Dokdonia sinensis]RMB58533.1 tail fiber domain-containing protein [Dokdonia sinensis]